MYFLNINKPKGMTSFDAIRELRKILKIKQIGHSGTLDPLAHGVMQVGVGGAAKLLDYLDSDKTYVADICFGYVSETFDDEGEKTFIKEPQFTKEELMEALDSFLGKTMQIPPKYSAIKINGKKMCDIARKNSKKDINKEIMPEIPEREINIYSIKLLNFTNNSAKIEVHCTKGTYIRSLANDLGKKLDCGAYLTDLQRTKAGNFDLSDSINLYDLTVKNTIESALKLIESRKINPLDCLPFEKYELNNNEFKRIENGNFIETKCNEIQKKNDEFILLTKDNKLVSLAKISDNLIKPKKFFREMIGEK